MNDKDIWIAPPPIPTLPDPSGQPKSSSDLGNALGALARIAIGAVFLVLCVWIITFLIWSIRAMQVW